ncbi:MAG: nucleotidyltransferase family protein [Candidatus Eremiobacteraeota bacterium]|nr:nucleotidyltransferase family protein [Candidatus Eremiobacteraeota bacterium]
MEGFEDLTAVILAGGLGTRLRSVLPDRPKTLAPVNGRPFLAYLLYFLGRAGIRHAVLSTGYKGEEVESVFGDHYSGMELAYSRESSPLGTGGALRLALSRVRSPLMLVINGDSFCSFSPREFLEFHGRHGESTSMVLIEVADTSRFGCVDVDNEGIIHRFIEKDSSGGPGFINAGIYLITGGTVAGIPEGKPLSLERDLFPALAGRGLFGYRSPGPFLDIGTPETFREAQEFFNNDEWEKIPPFRGA